MTKACESHLISPTNIGPLECSLLRASADIRDCEKSLNSAHAVIKLLHEKAKEHLLKLGLGMGVLALVAIGKNISL